MFEWFFRKPIPPRKTFDVSLPLYNGHAILTLPQDLMTWEADQICNVIQAVAQATDNLALYTPTRAVKPVNAQPPEVT